MKTSFFLISFLISNACFCQDQLFIQQTDSIISGIDSNTNQIEQFRWMLGYISYSKTNGPQSKITYSYKAGPKQIVETFYLIDSSLIFVQKNAAIYFLDGESLTTIRKYYFINNKLVCAASNQNEDENNPAATQALILAHLESVQSNIAWHKKKKYGG